MSSANDNDDSANVMPSTNHTSNVKETLQPPQPKIYICKCHLCGRKFTERRLLYSHYQKRHTMKDFLDGKCHPIADSDWQCLTCHFYYQKTYQQTSHDTNHCVNNLALIEQEKYEYDSDVEINIQVTGNDRFFGNLPKDKPKMSGIENGTKDDQKLIESCKCPYCDHWFSGRRNLYVHIEQVHGTKAYLDARQTKFTDSDWQCKNCKSWFAQKYNMASHERTQSCLQSIELAQSINYVYDPTLKLEFKVQPVSRETYVPKMVNYKCHLCGKRYANRKGRDAHLQAAHSMKDFLDARCSKVVDSDWQCEKCHFWYAQMYSRGSHEEKGACLKNIGKHEFLTFYPFRIFKGEPFQRAQSVRF